LKTPGKADREPSRDLLTGESYSCLWPWLVAVAAAGTALLAYGPCLGAPFFIVDDYQYVAANSRLQGIPPGEWWRIFTSRTNPWEYLPVRDLSFRLDLAIFGLKPVAFRLHNLLLYALCCLFVWPCTRSLVRALRPSPDDGPASDHVTGRWMAAFAVALFAAHPAHVESVAWISGRKDLLSGLFALLSLWTFAAGLRSSRRGLCLFVSAFWFGLAVLSKSTVVSVAGLAFVVAWAHHAGRECPRRAAARAVLVSAPLLVIAGASVAMAVFGSETATLGHATAGGAARVQGPLLPPAILGTLARIGVLPVRLRLVYDVTAPGAAYALAVVLGLLTAAATVIAAVRTIRRQSPLCLGIAAFGILLLPFLQLVPFTTWSLASERFLFLPALGLSLSAAVLLGRIRLRAAVALAGVLFVAGAALSLHRCTQWASRDTLLRTNAKLSPGNARSARLWIHYGLLKQGRYEEAREAASAVRAARERAFLLDYVGAREARVNQDAERLSVLSRRLHLAAPKEDYPVRVEIANMALQANLLVEAEQAFRAVLSDFPGMAEVQYNLGLVLARQGRHLDAAASMRAALTGGFKSAIVWNNLALSYRKAGLPAPAEAAFLEAMAADPRYWHAAYNLARLRLVRGNVDGAREALRAARKRAVAAGDATQPIDELDAHLRRRERPSGP